MRWPAGLLFVVALLCITARLWLPGLGKWLAYPASPHRADAIVVLGGDYPQRVLHGITLYQQGLALSCGIPAIFRAGPPMFRARFNWRWSAACLTRQFRC